MATSLQTHLIPFSDKGKISFLSAFNGVNEILIGKPIKKFIPSDYLSTIFTLPISLTTGLIAEYIILKDGTNDITKISKVSPSYNASGLVTDTGVKDPNSIPVKNYTLQELIVALLEKNKNDPNFSAIQANTSFFFEWLAYALVLVLTNSKDFNYFMSEEEISNLISGKIFEILANRNVSS